MFLEIKMKNFNDLISEYSIEIPIIQRDYVQGREYDEKAVEVRKNFLESIFNALEDDCQFHLDFIYGSFEKNKFIPIDGQQRLTTLFLLHWYFAKKEKISQVIKFTYKTRVSSREFCDKIFQFDIDFTDSLIKKQIIDSNQFIPYWENDPTIKSMLVVLDQIHVISAKKPQITYEKLNLITFEIFKLEDFRKEQSEELYRKMNSRGKSLTTFENFKAIIEQIVYKRGDLVKYKEIASKFEKNWIDNFWENYTSDNLIIDDSFMNFVYYITEMLSYSDLDYVKVITDEEKQDDLRKQVESFTYLKSFYQNEDNLNFLINVLDRFNELEAISNQIFNSLIFFEKNKNINLLHESINNNYSMSVSYKILLFIVIKSINHQENIIDLTRIVRNVLYKERALKTGKIDYVQTLSYEDIPKYFNEFSKIIGDDPYKLILDQDFKFKKDEFYHEKEKAKILQNMPFLKVKIFGLEDYKYIKGDLRLFLSAKFTYKNLYDRIEFLSDNLRLVFDNDDNLIIRSLLSIDDYRIWIGSVYHGGKYFFGQKGKWEILLTHNQKTKEKFPEMFSNFFEKFEQYSTLEKMIENSLQEYKDTNKDWIYYFQKYIVIAQKNDNLSNTFGWFDNNKDDLIEKLENEKRITGWHLNIFLLALLKELQFQNDRDYIKIDEKSGFSYLKINESKVYIENECIVYNDFQVPLFDKDDAIQIMKEKILNESI